MKDPDKILIDLIQDLLKKERDEQIRILKAAAAFFDIAEELRG